MLEHTTIHLPKNMPLDERISEVGKQIAAWLKSLDTPNDETGKLSLTRYEKDENGYSYQYTIINAKDN
jgi:hypothetical protein